jgi:transposase
MRVNNIKVGSVSHVDNAVMETPVDTGFINVSLYKKILEQRRAYGTCETAYILHDVYKLSYGMIAKLMGVSVGTVKQCVHRMRSRQQAKTQETQSTPVPLDIPAFEAFKEVCKDNALSLECQMLEAEAFVFDVAKRALPTTAFWDVFIYAKSVHRVAFPDIYNLLVELTDMNLRKLRRLLRAVRVKDRWYVGDGVVAYVYSLLDKSCFHRGYYNTRLSFNTLTVIELLARKNPTKEPLVYLTMVVSDRLAHLISMKRTEIIQTMKEVYATVTRMYDLD